MAEAKRRKDVDGKVEDGLVAAPERVEDGGIVMSKMPDAPKSPKAEEAEEEFKAQQREMLESPNRTFGKRN